MKWNNSVDLIRKSKHFGVNVRKDDGLFLTRENYCYINNKSSFRKGKFYDDEWCEQHYIKCMKNFDLNMEYFSCLPREEFDKDIARFIKKFPFESVVDLNDFSGKCGYYLMVLDKYKQVYIGTTSNIKTRIMGHWSKQKAFDRLLFGPVDQSIMSIDSFRALDTTQLYAYPLENIFSYEDKYINNFDARFVSNRMGGGRVPEGPLGLLETISSAKKRKLE